MSKNKVAPAELRSVLNELLLNGYFHIKAINKEIHEMGITDPKEATAEQQNKLRAMTMTLTLVNDLLHPAHKISKKILPESEWPIVDYCIRAQKHAFELKLIDSCFCTSCKEDQLEQDKVDKVSQN